MSNQEIKEAMELHQKRMKEKGYYYVPCKIGDTAYLIRRFHDKKRAVSGTICEIFFDKNMDIHVRIHGIGRGKLGEDVFLSRVEAEKKIKSFEIL